MVCVDNCPLWIVDWTQTSCQSCHNTRYIISIPESRQSRCVSDKDMHVSCIPSPPGFFSRVHPRTEFKINLYPIRIRSTHTHLFLTVNEKNGRKNIQTTRFLQRLQRVQSTLQPDEANLRSMREKQDHLCLRLVPSDSQRRAPDLLVAFTFALAFGFSATFAFRVETLFRTYPECYCYCYDHCQLHRHHHALYATARKPYNLFSPATQR